MMPLAWLREYTAPNGTTKGKAFCTTLGASTDFADEDLRRLFVNLVHHLTGKPVPEKADVACVDPFTPSAYGFLNDAYYKTLNLKPADYALGKSPATKARVKKTANNATHAPADGAQFRCGCSRCRVPPSHCR